MGVGHRAGARPAEMSGGEQQRAAIAVAVANQPKIILADEPTGALDTANAVGVIDLLLGMQQEIGATLIMVTHDGEAASRLDRQVHLRDGRVS
jgi:ABC-type lipoprotein export system ATPase subunit